MKRLIILTLTLLISGGAIAQKAKTIKVDGVKFKMIYVKEATFEMGGSILQDEQPKHPVTLDGYYIGETVVTKGLWNCIMQNDNTIREDGKTPVPPITDVSWNDCKEFINKLNQKTGLTFRLPTEAEWEYAANGGNTSHSGTYGKSNEVIAPGFLFSKTYTKEDKPNGLGIWYMLGNVWEWCEDWYGQYTYTSPKGPSSGIEHVLRGGGYYTKLSYCNSTYRASLPANEKSSDIGFRLAMTYVGKKK